jgi:anti-sigma regulatory factor (Ser/Thr protein kinase)
MLFLKTIMKIHLPNSARLQNLGGFLRRFDPSNPNALEFSMNDRWVAVHPAVLAFTACVADEVSRKGGSHEGVVHRIGSLPYLIRMGLFDHLHLDYGREIQPHEEAGRFIGIQRITTSTELSDFIVNMIPLLHAPPEQVEPIRYVISEIVRNVLEHSGAPGGAFLAAQYFKKTGTLSLGVADDGVGVYRTMSRFHRVTNDWEALCLALRPGISGTSAKIGGTAYNAGAGLFFTKSIAYASRNFFIIYSGNSMFKLLRVPSGKTIILHADPSRDHHTREDSLPYWHGTLVGIDISLASQRTFADLMRLIRDAYGLDVKGQRKARYKKARFT